MFLNCVVYLLTYLPASGRHYYRIQGSVRGRGSIWGKSRGEQIIMTRLRVGHCSLAKNLVLTVNHKDSLCESCKKPETIQHVVMFQCGKYKEGRKTLFSVAIDATF